MTDEHILPEADAPDLRGWDIERDGRMADYTGQPVGFDIEPYNPDKDPVLTGKVPDPYAGGDQ